MNQVSGQHIADDPSQATVSPTAPVRFLLRRSTLIAIIAIAVILRVGSALYQGNEVQALPGVYDQVSYDMLARQVVTGHGFTVAENWWPLTRAGEPTAHWSYLYTLYLSMLYAIAGPNPLLPRILQAGIAGILHCWLAWRIGRRIGGAIVGFVSAALSACYIYFFYYAGALMTETFYILGILWTLDCALRLAETPVVGHGERASFWSRQRLWLELGLAIGVTVLLRQVFMLFVPFLLLWLWWNQLRPLPAVSDGSWQKLRTTAIGSFLSILVVCLLIAPWTIRNYLAFHIFVPLNTNSGFALFWGNHPIYGTHFVGLLPSDGPTYQDLVPVELRHLNEAELDQALLKLGIGFMTADPVRILLLSISRAYEFFKFWPSPDSGMLSNISRVGSFGLLLPFIIYGLAFSIVLAWRNRDRQQRAAILLLVLFCVVYSGIHLLTWALIRYRLPVDAVLVIFAAMGIADLSKRIMTQRRYLSF